MKAKKKAEKAGTGKKRRDKGAMYWIPRILAIVYILFISMFALDIFDSYTRFVDVIVGLFMHLIPSFLLIIALVIAWKKERTGGIVFISLGILMILWFRTYDQIINFLTISFPVLVIGTLFIISDYIKKRG